MGGIKHGRWNIDPMNPRTSMPIGDNPAALAEWAARDVQVSCKICGSQILLQSSGDLGQSGTLGSSQAGEDWAEEVKLGMHKECFFNYMAAQHMKQNGN